MRHIPLFTKCKIFNTQVAKVLSTVSHNLNCKKTNTTHTANFYYCHGEEKYPAKCDITFKITKISFKELCKTPRRIRLLSQDAAKQVYKSTAEQEVMQVVYTF